MTELHLIVSLILGGAVAIWTASRIAAHQFDLREDLPAGLCNLSAIMAPVQAVAQTPMLTAWAICVGGPGGIVSILTPDLEARHDRLTRTKFWIVHWGLILDALICAALFPPDGGSALLGRLLFGVTVALAGAAVLNRLLSANYLFLRHKPATPSLLDRFGPWPAYLPFMIAIGAVAIAAAFSGWSALWSMR